MQEVQRLVLQGLIRILQAVNDRHLMLGCILGIDVHYAGKRIDAHILQVVAAGSEEGANHLCSCMTKQVLLLSGHVAKLEFRLLT